MTEREDNRCVVCCIVSVIIMLAAVTFACIWESL